MALHIAWASAFDGDLASFESSLLPRLFALGRLLLVLMAMARQERLCASAGSPVCRVVRHVRTVVGMVALVRLYFAGPTLGCPLDRSLALGADTSQFSLLSLGVRLAPRTSFEEAHEILGWFVPEAPSVKAIHAVSYLGKRREQMRYDELAAADLELGSRAVEGAIKNVVVQRFDRGGMRWTREGAQALQWLRCIDRNGDWEAFAQWVRGRSGPTEAGKLVRLQRKVAAELPKLQEAA